jgi:hypothetical protein
MNRIEKILWAVAMIAAADPVLAAVNPRPTPAPAIGLGLGAAALLGIGYRALKKRINP